MTRHQAMSKAKKLWGRDARIEQRKPYTNKKTGEKSKTHRIGYYADGPIPMFFMIGMGMNWQEAADEVEKHVASYGK